MTRMTTVANVIKGVRSVTKTFTDDRYEQVHAARNRRLFQTISIIVLLHWVYLLVVSYTFSGGIDWIILFGFQLPGYVVFAVANFVPWRWTRFTKCVWYAIISYVGCIVPLCVNYRTYACLSGSRTTGCQDTSRPGYLNNLLYSTVGPLIMLTVFRNALVFQLINNLAIVSTILMQVGYSPRITWVNVSLLVGAYAFFFTLRINQNKNEYGTYRSGVNLELQVEEVVALRDHEKEMARTRELLTNYIFHEIRVPLNTIVLSIDLLEDNFSSKKHLSKDEEETFDQVKAGLAAVQTVVNDALDIRRLEEGRLQMDVKPFDFPKFIFNLVWVMRFSWVRKGIVFSSELDERMGESGPHPMVLVGDASRLKQIISNLISNAVKFTPSGGHITLSVNILTMSANMATLRIAVKDTGIGISRQNQAKLFQPFVQIDANGNQQGNGSGLGLSICAHLVKIQGGTIGVISQVDEGSEFWFEIELPIHDVPIESVPVPVGTSGPTPSTTTSPLRILVTDDDYSTRAIMVKILSRMGHTVEIAENGLEALEKVSAVRRANQMYDVLFMDNKMPKMDGIDAINHLRMQGISQPIICLTGSTSALEEAELHGVGATDVLLKPCKIADIERILARLFPPILVKNME